MDTHWLLSVLERANQIASTSELDDLLNRMLNLIIEVCGAEAGTLYLIDKAAGELVFKVVTDSQSSPTSPQGTQPEARSPLVGQRMSVESGIVGATIRDRQPIVVEDVETDPRWFRGFTEVSGVKIHNMVSFPLLLLQEPIGVVQIFNFVRPELQIVQLLGNRMASEIDKAVLLQASQQRAERLQALVDIIGQISSSLDRDEILRMIISYGQQLLNAEAGSLFLIDEPTGDLLPYMATNIDAERIQRLRVPAGKGIIGYVVQTGETVLVADTSQDTRHYSAVDRNIGFQTRSILAVPLRTQTVNLGDERGTAGERVIGGLEALNKREGTFTAEDARLLETLANQAATVLQIAGLYANANQLFLGVVRALTAAIDAKDPYTEGHSQRVSDYAVAIAYELNLDAELIHHLRISGLLHDVGKIGISDMILKKPGRLDPGEYDEIKRHPAIGEKIMHKVSLLESELPGIAQHHERVDGTGYPLGLSGEALSLAGRIVAVADVFDALTSDRPYRPAQTPECAIEILCQGSGSHFDPVCVDALLRARQKGATRTQKEKEQLPL